MIYTCQTKNYLVNPNISMNQFISEIKVRARGDFRLSINEDIEIAEAGHPNNINGHDAELAPALEPSNTSIRQIYENKYKQTAFYIRKIPLVLNLPRASIETRSNAETEVTEMEEFSITPGTNITEDETDDETDD